MLALWSRLRRWRWQVAGLAGVAAFAILAGRFWHPYYGFTRFVQLDEADQRIGIREVREHPVFAYEGFNGYDGAAYVQIAFHPLLDSPELQPALGNVPYRARRILGSALAWLLAGGKPALIANVYASLNLAVWLVLALMLWRALPVTDGRSWLAWAGVMFSAGALHSVRLALTDLLGATLILGAVMLTERGRAGGAIGVLGLAALARETALAAVVALWRGPWKSAPAWLANGGRAALAALPLLAWIAYVRWKAGPAAQGFGNFTWPIVGWIEKWGEAAADYARHPQFWWLTTTTLLATVALTTQAVFLLCRRRPDEPWWRVGAAGVAMMVMLGTSVWEGHPGASTRVLLPMSVAFAVLTVRERAGWTWASLGALSVFSGVLALWHVPHDPRELAAGRFSQGAYLVRPETGWHGVERNDRAAWAWSAGRAVLAIETAPRAGNPAVFRVKLRAMTPRPLEVRSAGQVVWQGEVGERSAWIEFTAAPRESGRWILELHSEAPAVREGGHPEARALGFAVYDVELK